MTNALGIDYIMQNTTPKRRIHNRFWFNSADKGICLHSH